MTSYEFEMNAKYAVLRVLANNCPDEKHTVNDIQAVWFSHILGSKKVILIDLGKNNRIYEVTYNSHKDELYVDVYDKVYNELMKVNRIQDDLKDKVSDNKSNHVMLANKMDQMVDSDGLSDKWKSIIAEASDVLRKLGDD